MLLMPVTVIAAVRAHSHGDDPRLFAAAHDLSLRPLVGWAAAVVCACLSAAIVSFSLLTRLALESYVQTGWCGTGAASLEYSQRTLPYYCIVPAALLLVSHRAGSGQAVCRVSLAVALLGCVACAGIG